LSGVRVSIGTSPVCTECGATVTHGAAIPATILRAQGFTYVKSMAGGIERWSREIDPSVPRY